MKDLLNLLGEQLTRELTTPNDLVSLALTGEMVIRALTLVVTEDAPEEVHAAAKLLVITYYEVLRRYTHLIPTDLDGDLWWALESLFTFAGDETPNCTADQALDAVEEVLMVGRAAVRAERMTPTRFSELVAKTLRAAELLAPDCEGLWEAAESRATRALVDHGFPELHAWLEVFADFAPKRVRAKLAVRTFLRSLGSSSDSNLN